MITTNRKLILNTTLTALMTAGLIASPATLVATSSAHSSQSVNNIELTSTTVNNLSDEYKEHALLDYNLFQASQNDLSALINRFITNQISFNESLYKEIVSFNGHPQILASTFNNEETPTGTSLPEHIQITQQALNNNHQTSGVAEVEQTAHYHTVTPATGLNETLYKLDKFFSQTINPLYYLFPDATSTTSTTSLGTNNFPFSPQQAANPKINAAFEKAAIEILGLKGNLKPGTVDTTEQIMEAMGLHYSPGKTFLEQFDTQGSIEKAFLGEKIPFSNLQVPNSFGGSSFLATTEQATLGLLGVHGDPITVDGALLTAPEYLAFSLHSSPLVPDPPLNIVPGDINFTGFTGLEGLTTVFTVFPAVNDVVKFLYALLYLTGKAVLTDPSAFQDTLSTINSDSSEPTTHLPDADNHEQQPFITPSPKVIAHTSHVLGSFFPAPNPKDFTLVKNLQEIYESYQEFNNNILAFDHDIDSTLVNNEENLLQAIFGQNFTDNHFADFFGRQFDSFNMIFDGQEQYWDAIIGITNYNPDTLTQTLEIQGLAGNEALNNGEVGGILGQCDQAIAGIADLD